MPDLNWENPKLREEIITMMKWWAEKGIDGFRLDVINNISKDQSFPNDTLETPKNDGRTYYSDGPRIHEFLHLMNKEVFTPYQLVTVGNYHLLRLNKLFYIRNLNAKNFQWLLTFTI